MLDGSPSGTLEQKSILLQAPGLGAAMYPTGFTPIISPSAGEDEWNTTSFPPRARNARSVSISPFDGLENPTRNAMLSFFSAAGICAGTATACGPA